MKALLLKAHDCIGCERLNECAYAISMVQEKIECSPDEAKKILDQMIPDAQIEDLLELFEKYDEKDTPRDTLIDALLSNLSEETILSDEDALSTVQKNADQGTEREAYTVHCFSRAGYEINAMKDEKKGDYVITKDHVSQTLEVGGKNKNPKEADYVLRDNTDYPVGNAIPFWLMGMMW